LDEKPPEGKTPAQEDEPKQENEGADLLAERKERVTTVRVSDAQFETLDIAPKLAAVPPDALGLFVMNSEQPVLIKGAQRVTLGRHVEGSMPVSIDLTDYGAALLGVSRQHAAILVSQDMYLLQDLGSTNGTWLNEIRLPPHIPRTLKNGDMIRLGQLRIYVVFHAPKSDQSPEVSKTTALPFHVSGSEELLLEPDVLIAVTSVSKLTPRYLSAEIAPYLAAIEQMQGVIDEVKGNRPRGLSIQTIRQGPPIAVSIEGASETIHMLRTVVSAWRSQHAAKLSKMVQTTTEGKDPQIAKELDPALRDAQIELAKEILAQIAGSIAEDDLETHIESLMQPLGILATSPLKVMAKPQ
jgi:hypothetical protein